jgi:hypothetical protein
VSRTTRRVGAAVLAAAASLLLVLAVAAGYVRRAAVDADQFADRATEALRDESVRALIAARITDEVVLRKEADLIAARPIIQSVAAEIVGSRAFTRTFRAGVRDVHRAVFARDQHTVTLAAADAGIVLAAALRAVRPSLADEVEEAERVALVTRDLGGVAAGLADLADRVRTLWWLVAALCAASAAGALALSPDRRRTVVHLGLGAAAAGAVVVLAHALARSLLVGGVAGPEERAAADAVWAAFLGDLRTWGWLLAASGAVVAAAASSLIRPVDLREPVRGAIGRLAAEPRRPALRAVRAVALLAAGAAILRWPDAVLRVALVLVALVLIYEGFLALLRLVYRAPAVGGAPGGGALGRRRRDRRLILAPALVVVVLAAGATVVVGSGAATADAPAPGPCNGHAALCDRPLADVALVATHNSMAVPSAGWYAAVQDRPIADQLRDGVRGLLIDTHDADRLGNGRVRTALGSREELRRRAAEDGVSAEAVDAALRTRERLGFRGEGERGIYLCHTLCELGATPLEDVLHDLREFLVANPDEVVVVINQDQVAPRAFVAAVEAAGLGELAYRGPLDRRRPTLREMIDRDERVVFLAENRAGGAPWYRLAYERTLQETPYAFGSAGALVGQAGLRASCRPHRGPADAPLFLLNHWVTTDPLPRPSDAERVNAYEALMRRIRACERERGRRPTLVAVNFHRRGDVARVVDALNGVG